MSIVFDLSNNALIFIKFYIAFAMLSIFGTVGKGNSRIFLMPADFSNKITFSKGMQRISGSEKASN